MKRAALVSRGTVQRLILAARESWRNKNFEQTIEILKRANRLDPANTAVLLQLGWVHGSNYDYAAAESYFEKAIRIAPNKSRILAMAGEHCRDFRNFDLAQRYFRLAAEQADAAPDVLAQQAEFCERTRRIDDASALVDRALALNGSCGPALLARARLDRQAGHLEQAEKTIRSLLNQPDPGARQGPDFATRIRGWYELSAILDHQKRFDEAMAAAIQAKSMLRLHATEERAGLKVIRSRMAKLREHLTKEILHRWADAAGQLQPAHRLGLLGGHPRSGTTLLEQVLDSHPNIITAEETTIFHDDAYVPLTRGYPQDAEVLQVLETAQIPALQQARANYFRAMELSLGMPTSHRLLIDKNPSYTFLIPALVRVFPEIKVLVALRDPRDVVLSCFMQAFVPLGQTSSAYLSLGETVNEYGALMSMWTALKPLVNNPCLEVRYEEMVEDLESVSRRVLDFLGVAWDPIVLRFNEHARQKMVRSPTYADVTKPVFKTAVGRWRNYQKYFEPHLDKLEPFVKIFGYG